MSGVAAEDGSTFLEQITGIKNGDKANQTTLETPISELAGRTRNLKERLDAGAVKIRTVATVAAMKALDVSLLSDREVVLTEDMGLFVYQDDSGGQPELAGARYLPNSGAGIYNLHSLGNRNVANGVAGLDASAKVAAAQLRGTVIATYSLGSPAIGTGGTTMSGAIVESSSVDILDCRIGDIFLFKGGASFFFVGTKQLQYGYRLRKADATDRGFPVVEGNPPAYTQYTDPLYAGTTPIVSQKSINGVRVLDSSDTTAGGTTLRVHPFYRGCSGQSEWFFFGAILFHLRP